MIKLVRCDDRLIHGQCMTVITKVYSINQIIVIDEYVASNPVMTKIFKMAVSPNISLEVFSVKTCSEAVKAAISNNNNVLILTSTPASFPALYDAVDGLPKIVNIGPMSSKEGAVQIIYGTYLKDNELDAVRDLDSRGIDIYFNAVPERERVDWKDVKENINLKK